MIESAVATIPEQQTPAPRPRIGPHWLVGILIALYFIIAAIGGTQSPCANDMGGIFLPSARFVVADFLPSSQPARDSRLSLRD